MPGGIGFFGQVEGFVPGLCPAIVKAFEITGRDAAGGFDGFKKLAPAIMALGQHPVELVGEHIVLRIILPHGMLKLGHYAARHSLRYH